MRIGFLIDHWPPSHAGRSLAAFADHLVAIGHEVLVITDRVARGAEDVYLHQVRTHRFMTQARRARVLARALPEKARELGCERTVAAGGVERASVYWAQGGAQAAAVAARLRAQASSLGPVEREALPDWVESGSLGGREAVADASQRALLAGGARRVLAPNAMVRDELLRLDPSAEERIELVRTSIELERFRPWYGERDTIRARLGPAFTGELDALGRRIADCADSSGPYAALARAVRARDLEAPIEHLGGGSGAADDAHHRRTSDAPAKGAAAHVPALGAFTERDAPLLAFVARDPELKGLPALTRALARLVDRPWHLVVAGTARFSEVERYLVPFGPAMAEPSPNGTRFARRWSFMPQVDVGLLLRAANMTVVPTWRDTRGVATLASLATGRRVITTRHNGNADLILDGAFAPREQRITHTARGSVLFDPCAEEQLTEALAAELEATPTEQDADSITTSYEISKAVATLDRRRVHGELERALEEAE